jgi:2'-5' RNA ligase
VTRLFIAVDLAADAREHAVRVISALKRLTAADRRTAAARISWVPAENLHLTLHFLGALDESRAQELAEAMSAPLAMAPFALTLGDVSAFPSGGAPRVIWIRVREGVERLERLHGLVADRLHEAGFSTESRPFRAHLTVGRVRDGGRPLALALRLAEAGEGPAALVDEVTLYESHVSPKGSRYESLCRTPLVERQY